VRNASESTARVAMFSSQAAAVGAVVKRSSAEDDFAPWTTGEA